MSHLIQPVHVSLVATAPARSATPDLLDDSEWAVVDEHNLAVAVAKPVVVSKVEHNATQVAKRSEDAQRQAGVAQIEVKAEFAGRLSELAAALAAHDLARVSGQVSTMTAQEALDNLTALLHRQLGDSLASPSTDHHFKRPNGRPAAVAVRARERRWAEHEAAVTGKADVAGHKGGEREGERRREVALTLCVTLLA